MTNKKLLSLSVLLVLFTGVAHLYAQKPGESQNDALLPPSEETFQKIDSLATPWMESSDCFLQGIDPKPVTLCNSAPIRNADKAQYVAIYDSSGSVWFDFNLYGEGLGKTILEKAKDGFAPLSGEIVPPLIAMLNKDDTYEDLVLRMTGESDHWYEVEINENTHELKYLPKDVPMMWAKVSWDHWLLKGGGVSHPEKCGGNCLVVDRNHRELLKDTPNGKSIEKAGVYDVDSLYFLKTDGDWAYVRIHLPLGKPASPEQPRDLKGWIRWRDGRNFLVGCVFNHYKITAAKATDTDQALFLRP